MKFLKITLVLLFLILSMSLVSAQDNITDALQNDTCQTEKVDSFKDLKNEIDIANDTLEITNDYINEDYPDGIKIAKDNLIINGNNHTLDGNNQNIFLITGSNITINNLVFKNAYYHSSGGAIYNNGELALNNVTFVGNIAGNFGGAIYNNGKLTLNNANFIENNAIVSGGAIYNSGELALKNATFVNNSADYGGAITNYLGTINLNESIFINNSAKYDGGAIFNYGEFTLNGCAFINNSAERSGGAITNYMEFILTDSVFIHDFAGSNGGAISNSVGYIASDNCTFINNSAQSIGGAIDNYEGVIDLSGGVFINNSATNLEGGVVGSNGNVTFTNSKFMDNDANTYGSEFRFISVPMAIIEDCYFEATHHRNYGPIWAANSNLYVNNSIFANYTVNYASAIYTEYSNLTVNNTQFVNLKANKTAGTVAIKSCDLIIIENSDFINTSAAKNGGAIFININNDENYNSSLGLVHLSNLSFINSSGDFGGAYVQLGGKLNLSDSEFVNCTSKYDGGAIYLSCVDGEINNCTFNSNKVTLYDDYPTFGGVIYLDHVNLSIYDSKFINNSAFADSGAIGIYDSLYHIVNSTLDNGEAIHDIFKRDKSKVINCSGNYTVSDENVFYPQMVAGSAINLTLITNEINVENPPIRFDLRDYNWTSPIKNQGNKGFCWAFSGIGSLESALLKSSGLSFDFSENNLNTMLIYSKYGPESCEGGYTLTFAGYLLSWLGPVQEEYDPYDDIGKLSPIFNNSDKIHIQDFIIISRNPEIIKDSILKQAILKYGAIDCDIAAGSLESAVSLFYNPEEFTLYNPDYVIPNHEVCVVGWDDTFSRDKFLETPPGDGAWICKNSWGSNWGDEGYFYVSYYDKTFAACSDISEFPMCLLVENTVAYNKNYQYDFNGLDTFLRWNKDSEMYRSPITYANKFVASDDDLIAAVGTYFNQSDINYTIKIEVNGKTALTQTGISPYRGYHTIKLDAYIPIKEGDEFCVYITSNALPVSYSPNLHYKDNVSMTDLWGDWTDIFAKNKKVACIKAYTVEDDSKIINNNDISLDYTGDKYFTAKITTADGHIIIGAEVKFTINGKTTSAKTDSNGIAKIKITSAPGKYTITTKYNGKTYRNTVTVKHILTAPKATVKKTAKKFTLKATLKINGKPVKGKTVTFKFKGKTYKAKTNKKGIAQKTLKKKIIKKLKKGKTYTVKVTYIKDTIKSSVKVR